MHFAIRAAVLLAAGAFAVAASPVPGGVHTRSSDVRALEGRSVTLTVDQDGRHRLVRRCEGPVCGGTWFDGQHVFTFGINGVTVPESDADVAAERARAAEAPPGAVPVEGALEGPAGNVPAIGAPIDLPWVGPSQQIVVPCRLRARAMRCLIDTGTTPSAITLPVADALGLVPRGELEMAGARRFLTGLVEAGPLVAGNVRWERFAFAVIPRFEALAFDAILGNDALAGMRITIDRAHHRVRFETSGAPASGTVLPLHFASGLPYVDGTLGGRTETLLFDTGDSALVSVGYDRFRRGGLRAAGPANASVRAEGIAGSTDAFPAVGSAQIGGLDFGEIAVRVNRTQAGGHVGAALALRCALTIDEPAGRVECQPEAGR